MRRARSPLVFVVWRWDPPICGHHFHVAVYRAGRIVASESGPDKVVAMALAGRAAVGR